MNDLNAMRSGGGRGLPAARPHIRPPYSRAEVIFTTLTYLSLVALIGVTTYSLVSLPTIIPTHFGFDGTPNAYGSKYTLLLLPGILIVITGLFALLSRYPWMFNYPVTITAENAERQYRRGRTLLIIVNAVIALLSAFIQWQTARVALGLASSIFPAYSMVAIIVFIAAFPMIVIGLIVWWATRGA